MRFPNGSRTVTDIVEGTLFKGVADRATSLSSGCFGFASSSLTIPASLTRFVVPPITLKS